MEFGIGSKHTEEAKAVMRSKRKLRIGENAPNYKGLDWTTLEYRQEYRKKNRKLFASALRRWRAKNKEQNRLLQRLDYYRRTGAKGSHTLGEWETLKKQYGFSCPKCKRSEPEIKLTEDHIIPITKGGSSYIENIQPLCVSCNSSKGTKIISFNFVD